MIPPALPLLTEREPAELLVHDEEEACSYLPNRMARLPLRLPVRSLSGDEFDARLSEGDRRHGILLYRPTCGACNACEAIRLDVGEYSFSKTQRRILRKNDALLRVQVGPSTSDPQAVSLYDKHRYGRGLDGPHSKPMDALSYERFLVERCCQSYEMRFFLGEQVVAIAIVDEGATALSAVYCHHDPAHSSLSLGTYAILKQIERARLDGKRFLYLGLYVSGCGPMEYKVRFKPHERLVAKEWTRFEK
ncbi:MAG: arginyl-tRNA--protein-N-Asp/Glu arginylyltransferase [Polyangiales bacterium]|jgi:arginyl-tRNA--protein-N-Asp/Glu arginylyltransferase